MKINFKVGAVTLSRDGSSLEDEARKLSTHFSTLSRLAADGREAEFESHPANVNYVPPAPSVAREEQTITAEDVGTLKPEA